MYELKKIGKLFTSEFVGTGPLSYKKEIYWAAVSQRLRNIALDSPVFVHRLSVSGKLLNPTFGGGDRISKNM